MLRLILTSFGYKIHVYGQNPSDYLEVKARVIGFIIILILIINFTYSLTMKCLNFNFLQVSGNKMDAHNLATLFGPNILHRTKAVSDKQLMSESAERVGQCKEVIEVVKDMIDNHHELFEVSPCWHLKLNAKEGGNVEK